MALAVIAAPITIAIAPVVVQAAPSAPTPGVAPADPGTPTTTSPTTTSPTTGPGGSEPAAGDPPPTSAPDTTATTTSAPPTAPTTPTTPATAVVLADVATGPPPLVPQLASQGASVGGATSSLVRPARAELPVTGGDDGVLCILSISFAGLGAVLVALARRRPPRVTGV